MDKNFVEGVKKVSKLRKVWKMLNVNKPSRDFREQIWIFRT